MIPAAPRWYFVKRGYVRDCIGDIKIDQICIGDLIQVFASKIDFDEHHVSGFHYTHTADNKQPSRYFLVTGATVKNNADFGWQPFKIIDEDGISTVLFLDKTWQKRITLVSRKPLKPVVLQNIH